MEIMRKILSERRPSSLEFANFMLRNNKFLVLDNGMYAKLDGHRWVITSRIPTQLYNDTVLIMSKYLSDAKYYDSAVSKLCDNPTHIRDFIRTSESTPSSLFDSQPYILNTPKFTIDLRTTDIINPLKVSELVIPE